MDEYVDICVLESNAAATILTSLLETKNIPHRVVNHRDSAFSGAYKDSLGWGHLEAPEAYRDEIRAVLESMSGGADTETPE